MNGLTDYTIVELEPGMSLEDAYSMAQEQRKKNFIDLDDVFARFNRRDFFTERPGLTAVIALGMYAHLGAEVYEGVNMTSFLTAGNILQKVMNMQEVCCSEPWCIVAATYNAVQRYNDTYGVPGWLFES